MTAPDRRDEAPDRATRGRTAPGRLAALDDFLVHAEAALLIGQEGVFPRAPFIDIGYGETPATTLESAARFRQLDATLEVIGVEREAHRVEAAQAWVAESQISQPQIAQPFIAHPHIVHPHIAQTQTNPPPLAERAVTRFVLGGFETVESFDPPARLIRAMNVLRTYPLEEIHAAHQRLGRGLVPGGLLVEGSCDPAGAILTAHLLRRTDEGLRREALLFFTRFEDGFAPLRFRDWLPRDLRRDVRPGTPIHAFLTRWTSAWAQVREDGHREPEESFVASVQELIRRGELIRDDPWLIQRGYLLWSPPEGIPETQR